MGIKVEEWLEAAQRTALGSKRRIKHMFENRENMVVFNNADSWSCWCFSCNDGATVRKTLPMLPPDPVCCGSTTPNLPDDCEPLQKVSKGLQGLAYTYLLVRGIDPDRMLEGMQVLISPLYKRLMLEQQGQAFVGRGLVNQKIKSIVYCSSKPPSYAIHPQDTDDFSKQHVVLTEDYLSALKIRHCTNEYRAISVQGSSIGLGLIGKLLQVKSVSIMLDGDPAGVKGSAKILNRLQGLIPKIRVINTPTGRDPKNLNAHEIRSLLVWR